MYKSVSPQSRIQKIRRFVYIFVIVAGLFNIFFPVIAHADIFHNEVQDLYAKITENVKETNDILNDAFDLCQTSPYDIINSTTYNVQGGVTRAIHSACQTVALVVATLLLMVDFFRKTTNFEWASKWENVLLFLVKIVVVKIVITNADEIVGHIYTAFNFINEQATGGHPTFLPYGDEKTYTITIKYSLFNKIKDQGLFKGVLSYLTAPAHDPEVNLTYVISQKAVNIFYPDVILKPEGTYSYDSHPFAPDNSIIQPTIERLLMTPYFLAMKAIAYIVFVIAVGRVFELSAYLLFAPLPLATFASDTTNDVAKHFIKNFIACVLQVAVIVVMFIVYVAVTKYVMHTYTTPILSFVTLFCLGLGVMKSGTWAKHICGIG